MCLDPEATNGIARGPAAPEAPATAEERAREKEREKEKIGIETIATIEADAIETIQAKAIATIEADAIAMIEEPDEINGRSHQKSPRYGQRWKKVTRSKSKICCSAVLTSKRSLKDGPR